MNWVAVAQRLGCSKAALWPIRNGTGPLPLKCRKPYIEWRNSLIREGLIPGAEPIEMPIPEWQIPTTEEAAYYLEKLIVYSEHRGMEMLDSWAAVMMKQMQEGGWEPPQDPATKAVLERARELVAAAGMHEHDEGFLTPLKALRDALKALQPADQKAKLV